MPILSLQIAQPCPESWEAMIPTEGGRHCAACQKTVVDFTWKTDAEILAFLANASGETCGRLWSDQQNRPLVSPLPARPAPRWRAWLATALALWGTRESQSLGATAHPAPAASSRHASIQTHKPSRPARGAKQLHGTVRDAATHEPLAGVAIFLKGENRRTTTDSAGRFSLRLPAGPPAGRRRRLVLHRAGYLSRQLPLAPGGQLELALRADPAAAGAEVVGILPDQKRWVMGGAVTTIVGADKVDTPLTPPPAARPAHGFFQWLTRPFRRS
ncbi:carboxypeptidase regulatory-like domain-containing protein [Hymenobacter cheonanensis]|uniref:carboxypeptidase regulatory-like domain-containing protein n=1 Tax=Hymenobacter sp. CA2-7 TaxID=3063993 RepID=UPI0027124395|nr:carboxypeptidase regulatory-like domain-containing protein [Hymenobacter sp. CA2-7]MDO7884678.1 carboxypeptidase-like regulatory domain-containing protein [Hymenobacter sp. CA2-7]